MTHLSRNRHARLYPVWSAIAALVSIPFIAPAAEAVFQRLKTKAAIPCHHQLTRIQDIPYQCWEFQDPEAKLPVWKQSLGFEFGKLTRAQWEQIAIAYASWRTSATITKQLPPYDRDHHYWLMDFMPPFMQAVNRHRFVGQTQPTQPSATPSILTNCWGTLYEILRLKNAAPETRSYLMMVDAETMLNTFKDLSEPVAQPQPGDFLLISHRHPISSQDQPNANTQTYLDHGALFIDQGILFEKAGAGDRVPYRLIGLSTVQRIWRRDVFDYQIRRPITNQSMPHPLSFSRDRAASWTNLSLDQNTQAHYEIFPLPPLRMTGSRAELPQQVYEPDYYQSQDIRPLDQHTVE